MESATGSELGRQRSAAWDQEGQAGMDPLRTISSFPRQSSGTQGQEGKADNRENLFPDERESFS